MHETGKGAIGKGFRKKNQTELLRRIREDRQSSGIVMEDMYRYLGITRQGFYQQLHRKQLESDFMKLVKEEVREYRQNRDRRAGSRSLYYNLGIKERYGIGVNKFEQLMSRNKLTLAPLRLRVVTTKSVHQSWNYDNLLNGLKINDINQAVAGDLTYVYIGRYCYYVFSLTDIYSARLVGIWGSDRMRAKDAKRCLESWVNLRGRKEVEGCIHHTDGGSQYFSELYLAQIQEYSITISVAKNCLENGYAEQRNGLFKHHFYSTLGEAEINFFRAQLGKIDYFYNYERKQKELGWRTPVGYEQYIGSLAPENRPIKRLHEFRQTTQN